jgi:hypothetical protein
MVNLKQVQADEILVLSTDGRRFQAEACAIGLHGGGASQQNCGTRRFGLALKTVCVESRKRLSIGFRFENRHFLRPQRGFELLAILLFPAAPPQPGQNGKRFALCLSQNNWRKVA